MRKIVVDNIEYEWQVGKSHVLIKGPNFKKTPTLPDATNGVFIWRDFEKRNAYIIPSMIERFIRKHVSN